MCLMYGMNPLFHTYRHFITFRPDLALSNVLPIPYQKSIHLFQIPRTIRLQYITSGSFYHNPEAQHTRALPVWRKLYFSASTIINSERQSTVRCEFN